MAVTIQQIAERAGVSRGTVDRALNHRGRINPEVAEKICRLADEMGYVQKERKRSRTAKDERLKIGVVTQLARSSFMQEVNRGIEKAAQELKEKGIWFVCADMGGETMYDLNLTGPIGLVIGNEGSGVGRLVKEKCDMTASIPMHGDIDSLNASVAAGVLAYEIVRQRTCAGGR